MTWLYRTALRLLPRDVREQHGDQMSAVFAQVVRDAERRRGRRGIYRAVAFEIAALVWFAWCERLGRPAPRRIDERMFSWPVGSEGSIRMIPSFTQDIWYAARMLRRTPGFTLVCVSTMALAIGANTAIFSVVHGVLLKPLPFAHPGRIVVLGNRTDGGTSLDMTTPGNFYDWRAGATGFEAMAAFSYEGLVFTWNGNAERIVGVASAGSIFDVLGRHAAEGRTFTAAEDEPGAEPVVVLSSKLAMRMFGTRPALGQSIGIDGEPHTVIGVMPPDFSFPDYDAEYWLPARWDTGFRNNRDQYFSLVVARLKNGIGINQAATQLNTVMDRIRRDYPQFTQNATAGIKPMRDVLVSDVRARLLTLMGAVVVILLIACANLGNLLLARASTRKREIAVRHALGARPMRLIRQMLTESMVLAVIGGVLGLTVGAVMLKTLIMLLPEDLPRLNGVALDADVFLFTAAVSLLSGVLFGLFPAFQLANRAPIEAVREGSRGSARSKFVRTTLVVSEVALALMLLAGAGLLMRSFGKLLEVHPGFRSDRLLTFRTSLPTRSYETASQRATFFEAAVERLRALPGVRGVTIMSSLPVSPNGNGAWFNRLDKPIPADRTPPSIPYRVVGVNYLKTMGIPLLRGRDFTEDDRVDRTRAIIVSSAAARRFWPNEDPIGKLIYLGAPDNKLFTDATVVGITADVKITGLGDPTEDVVYVPHRLMPSWNTFTFALRTTMDPTTLAAAVRVQLGQLDPGVPMVNVRTMDDVIARSVAPARSSMLLVGLFAAVALVLAVIGVFGVLSYTVTQRTTELGIRMALGASATRVKLLVLGQGMAPVLGGVAVGLGGAVLLTRFISSLLFGVSATDPVTFATVSMALTGVAAMASYLPARRATRVDPMSVLRQE
jgi:putative ABC transport system permease protein